MAGSGRFELASGSTEGSALAATIPNGQRANYSSANLDRLGSFRDGCENRSGSSSSRGSTILSIDMPPLTQCLTLEPITLVDQKFTRSGELRRIFGVSVGNTLEDHCFGAAHYKPPPSISSEELKRFKAGLVDISTKARDRVKKFQEHIIKLDKYRHTFSSRKRRAELSSSERSGGANPMKRGNQIQQKPLDLVNQRLDKNIGLNKCLRTSVAEMETKNNAPSRQNVTVDKDRDMLKGGVGGSGLDEQNIRGMPAGGDGRDNKMKRKRSVGTVVNRTADGDQELKRTMRQKLSNDCRLRSPDVHGFRAGPFNGVSEIKKSDGTSQLTSSNSRTIPRIELENVSLSNDRRDHAFGLDKERAVTKPNNKLNILENNQVGSHSPVTKGKAFRAPRTGSGVTSSSPNIPRTPGSLEGLEQPSGLNKVQSLGGVNNRKRPLSTRSSSPPVAQLVGQRPPKNSRTRRANPVSPVSNHDEGQTLSEEYPTSDISTRLTSSETAPAQLPKGVSMRTQPYKMKLENVPSPARFFESEESGAGENKLKEKHVDYGEIEDRSVNTVKKVGSFISSTKKNKTLTKEDTEDGVRRQGRSSRGLSLARACIPPTREKLNSPVMTKPLRSMRTGSDKNESKPGRPPSRKFSDLKAFTRRGNALNSGSSGFIGESDDDREELLAAANAAHSASFLACSGSFWKKAEPLFASVSSEDTTFLRQQLRFVEELDESPCKLSGTDLNILGKLGCKKQSQLISCGERLGSIVLGRAASSVSQLQEFDTFCGILDMERQFEKVTPLYQRVIAALIGEDEISDFDHVSEGHESFQYASDDSPCVTIESDLDSEVYLTARRNSSLHSVSCYKKSAFSTQSSLQNGELWEGDGDLMISEIGTISVFGGSHLDGSGSPTCSNSSAISSSDCQYQLMCLDDKLMLELQSIGLYPERVPELAEGEEEITKDILELKQGLFLKVGKKKGKLSQIEKALLKGGEVEGRAIEQIAMNKLVEMAYKKRMACRGGNFSRFSKASKAAALAFVKRTIARCREFEDSGRSCFSEPALREVILSAPPYINGRNFVDTVRTEAASNTCAVSTKREVPLEDIGVGGSRAIPLLGNILSGGAKGKRSERDRDQNKDMSTSSSVAKIGRPSLGSLRGERKTKTKPKQKIAQLSPSGNTLLGRFKGTTESVYRPVRDCNGTVTIDSNKVRGTVELPLPSNTPLNSSKETAEPILFANFNESESIEEIGVSNDIGGPQDLYSWLNFDEDGLQDHDSIGLEIPMDDLTDLQMII